jgi:transposase
VEVYGYHGKIYMFLDNARSHHAKLLKTFLESVKEQLELVFLPPYSPDLSEIEKLWQEIKSEVVYNGYYDTSADFQNALTRAFRRKNNSGYIKSLFDEKKYLYEELLIEL